MSEETNTDTDFIAAPLPGDVAPADSAGGKPPRARVEDAVDTEESPRETMERKRDYLEGFLQKKPENVPAGAPGGDLYEAVISALKEIYDPEIPVNIYDLGLVYTIEISDENDVKVIMTLTAPGCPVAGEMPGWIADAVGPLPGVKSIDVEITWDPPWGMDMMSDEARLELGFM